MYKIIGADGNQYGPVSLEEIKSWVRDRRANRDTLVQGPGSNDWKPLRDLPEFSDVLATLVSPAPQPFASPGVLPGPVGMAASPQLAASMVSGPGIALIVLGVLVGLGNVAGIFMNLLGVMAHQSTGDPQMDKIVNLMSGGMGVISGIIGIVLAGLTIFAGIQMQKLRNYSLVMAMLILNMIPCCNSCCCVIGLPIGIWGLVILMKPEVKSAFK